MKMSSKGESLELFAYSVTVEHIICVIELLCFRKGLGILSYVRRLIDHVIGSCVKMKRQLLFKKQLLSLCKVFFFK